MLSVYIGLQIYTIGLITVLSQSMPAITLLFSVWWILQPNLKTYFFWQHAEKTVTIALCFQLKAGQPCLNKCSALLMKSRDLGQPCLAMHCL